jgi:hypothetical protein
MTRYIDKALISREAYSRWRQRISITEDAINAAMGKLAEDILSGKIKVVETDSGDVMLVETDECNEEGG